MKTKKLRLWPFLLAIPAAFLLGKCSGSGDTDSGQQMYTDSIALHKAKIASLEANLQVEHRKAGSEKQRADSLKSVKQKVVTHYVQIHNSVTPADTVGCRDLFVKFENLAQSCDSLNAVNDSIIASQERRDTALLSVISIQHEQLGLKDSIIQEQEKGLETAKKDLKKAGKKVRRNRVIAGISVGIGVIIALL
jgi:hypothetical protein